MTPYLFKFYLMNDQNQYYYIGNDGTLQVTGDKTAIRDTPNGWEEMRIKLGRHKWYGIVTSITTPLSFRGDGEKILRGLYYANGQANFEAYCKVVIEKRIDTGLDIWQYEEFGTFLVDFANELSDGDAEDGGYFTVKLFEENVMTEIEAKAETPFDLDFTGAVQTQMNGVELNSQYRWVANNIPAVGVLSGALGSSQSYVVPMGLISEETDYFRNLIETQSQGSEVHTLNFPPNDANKLLYTNIALSTISYELTANVTVTNVGGATGLRLRVDMLEKNMTTNSNDFSQMIYQSPTDIVGSSTISITQTGTLNFDPFSYDYFLIMRTPADAQGNTTIAVNSIDFRFNLVNALPTSDADTLKYPVFARKLIDKVTDGNATLTTGFLDYNVQLSELYKYYGNIPYYTHVTSGDELRGIEDSKVTSTFNDMMQDAMGRWMVGMDVTGNNISIEQLPFFFKKDTVIATINEISNFSKRTATDWIYNTIKTGYPDVTLDKTNGKYEINSEQYWKLFFKRAVNDFDLQSPYRADVYGIEYTRGDYFGKDTTDTGADNSVFLIEVANEVVDGKMQLLKYDTPPDATSGVFSPETHYNWGLTPETFILRWIPYFKSILNVPNGEYSGAQIEFVSGKKNTNYSKYINGYNTVGGVNIFAATPTRWTNPEKLFVPLIFEFECEQPLNIYPMIKENPYGVIRAVTEQGIIEGFILDAEINPSTKDRCKFTLLCSPNTDTTIFA